MTLDPDDIEAIARAIVELQEERQRAVGLVGAQRLAAILGVDPSWVYANRERLGGKKLGPERNAPVRFDPEEALRRFHDGRLSGETASSAERRQPPAQRSRRAEPRSIAPLLPLRGRS